MYINCLFCILRIIAIFAYYFLAWYIQTMYSEVSYIVVQHAWMASVGGMEQAIQQK